MTRRVSSEEVENSSKSIFSISMERSVARGLRRHLTRNRDLVLRRSSPNQAVSKTSPKLGRIPEDSRGLERTINPNRKTFEARKRETAALGAGEKLVLGHPLAATIGDSARCMQNLEKVLFTGPKTSDTVTFICD